MPEQEDLNAFAFALAEEIRERALGDEEGAEFRENVFVDLVSEHLADIGMLEDPVICYYEGRVGNGSVRLNGYAANDDGERLDLLAALFHDQAVPTPIDGEDVVRVASQAARVVQAAKRHAHERMEKSSDAYAMMRRISEILERGVQQVRVFVLCDGIASARRIKSARVAGMEVRFELYDLRRIARTMSTGKSREIIDINLAELGVAPIPCVSTPSLSQDYQAYLAVIPGEVLYRIYDEFGPRLLEYNVRAFLQATGKVNRGIRDTLKDEPHHFMAYNNGISITVDEIDTEVGSSGLAITRLKGLQIVNGGQTTASLHRARRRDGIDLSAVYVPAKITRLPADQIERMVPRISRFANTQNVIQEADFSSNEPFHIALERLSKTIWCPNGSTRWFYERARGQYRTAMNLEGSTPVRLREFKQRTPSSQRFTKTDVAKVLNSWNRLPHLVSSGAQKNFISYMRSLRQTHSASWEPDEAFYRNLVSKTILYNATTRIVRQEGFPAYRANIVCYLMAFLSHRCGGQLEFEELWRRQSLSAQLEQLIRSWAAAVAGAIQQSAEGRNVTEWCKKEGCWNAVKSVDVGPPDPRPPEMKSAEVSDDADSPMLSADEQSAAAECMKVTAEQWFAVQAWGRRSGKLAAWQSGIAHTLSSYAAGAWQRVPSVKQARHAIRILEIAREEGFDLTASIASDHEMN
jgi:hypothetical protein